MPARYRLKDYADDTHYHLYNRGVEKRLIFRDRQDYRVFFNYLQTYLMPKDEKALGAAISDPESSPSAKDRARKLLRMNNFFGEIYCLAFVLMPNHFHFFLRQKTADAIDRFMNSLCTRFTMYVNRKYKRVGPLFQGVYKAVMVTSDEQFLHLSRYIHRNPVSLVGQHVMRHGALLEKWEDWPYSSYQAYIGRRTIPWVQRDALLTFFNASNECSYKTFVCDTQNDVESLGHIKTLAIDLI